MTICAQKIWKLVNDVFHSGHAISHYNVLFGVDLDLFVNYVFSIIIYYIHNGCMISSFENKRRIDASSSSLKTYLTLRVNVYLKCSDPIWHGVCIKLEILIVCLEIHIDM